MLDDLFEQTPEAVVRYSPDDVKPRFREFIRAQLATHSDLTELLNRLPPETVSKYKKVCHESEYFTNADLWALIPPLMTGSGSFLALVGEIQPTCAYRKP